MESRSTYRGNDKLLFGVILGVLAFWLFAQTTLNINVVMAKDLQMDSAMMNIAVSITSLFSGIFIVVAGGLADRVGRLKIIWIGFIFSIIGSLLVGFTPVGEMATTVLITGRIFQGLSGACIMPASLALLKAYWEGPGRQRTISLWYCYDRSPGIGEPGKSIRLDKYDINLISCSHHLIWDRFLQH